MIDEDAAVRGNRGNCHKLGKLLYTFPDRVRSLAHLHAKVAIGDELAMLGSFNFTEGGFNRNFEMGVLIDDKDIIEDLVEWFDELWQGADQLRSEEIFMANCLGDLPESSLERHLWEIGSRRFANGYLIELGRMIRHFRLENDDPRLVMSLPKRIGAGYGSGALPVTVGRRYVAYVTTNYFVERTAVLTLSLPQKCGRHLVGDEVDAGELFFKRQIGEDREDVPMYAWLPYFDDDGRLSPEVRSCWYQEIAYELERAKASPWKKHHQADFYRAAVDRSFRNKFLGNVF